MYMALRSAPCETVKNGNKIASRRAQVALICRRWAVERFMLQFLPKKFISAPLIGLVSL